MAWNFMVNFGTQHLRSRDSKNQPMLGGGDMAILFCSEEPFSGLADTLISMLQCFVAWSHFIYILR